MSMPVENPATTTFSVRPSYRWLALGTGAFFVVMFVTNVYAAWFNIDGSFARPKLAAVLLGTFWSAWVVVSVWLGAFSVRYRLTLTADQLVQRGALFTATIPRHAIAEIRWRTIPVGGSALVMSPFGNATIEFSQFTAPDRTAVIDQIRALAPPDRQARWDDFHRRWILGEAPAPVLPPHWARRILLWFFALNAVAFATIGIVCGDWLNLIGAGVNAAFVVWSILRPARQPTATIVAGPQSGRDHSPVG